MSRPSFSCRMIWSSLIHVQLESLIGMPKDIWKYKVYKSNLIPGHRWISTKKAFQSSSILFFSDAWSFWEVGTQPWCFPWCLSCWAPTRFLTQLNQTWMIQLVSSADLAGNFGLFFCSVALVVWGFGFCFLFLISFS